MTFEPRRLIRYQYLKLRRLKDEPRKVALGFGIGILVGFTPTVGIQMYIAAPLAFLCRGSAIAAAAAVWISNPVTMAGFYFMDFKVGKWLIGSQLKFSLADPSFFALIKQTGEAFWLMMVGGVVMGLPAGAIAYVFLYRLLEKAKQRRRLRQSNIQPR